MRKREIDGCEDRDRLIVSSRTQARVRWYILPDVTATIYLLPTCIACRARWREKFGKVRWNEPIRNAAHDACAHISIDNHLISRCFCRRCTADDVRLWCLMQLTYRPMDYSAVLFFLLCFLCTSKLLFYWPRRVAQPFQTFLCYVTSRVCFGSPCNDPRDDTVLMIVVLVVWNLLVKSWSGFESF